ncbi:MAG: hypothetical protein ACRDO4_04630, partial [Nocardioides sp.]
MPTALFSTDAPGRVRTERAWWRPVHDVGHLLRFRAAAVRRRTAFRWSVLVLVLITLAAGTVPAFVPADPDRQLEIAVLLPTGMAAILVISVVSAIASGGGRELISREQGVAFPVSPTTDHLGALLLAPLNIAWLIQAWVLLGSTAYVSLPERLPTAQTVMLLWLAMATAGAQVIAWVVETIRRRPRGVVTMRLVLVMLAGTVLAIQLAGRTTTLLDQIPTLRLVVAGVAGFTWAWVTVVILELAVLVLLVVAGAVPAHLAARRLPHDELRAETDT